MTVLRRPMPRFLLWIALLVGVAIAAGFAQLDWWLIALLEFVAWVIVATVERALTLPRQPRRSTDAVDQPVAEPPAPVEGPSEESIPEAPGAWPPTDPGLAFADAEVPAEEQPEPAPAAPSGEDEPAAADERQRRLPRPPRPAPPPPIEEPAAPEPAAPADPAPAWGAALVSDTGSVQWNLWSLERLAREQMPENEELNFTLVYLRDYADAGGVLPASFDALVRELFGETLATAHA